MKKNWDCEVLINAPKIKCNENWTKFSQIFGCDNTEYQEILCFFENKMMHFFCFWSATNYWDKHLLYDFTGMCIFPFYPKKLFQKIQNKEKKNEDMFKMQHSLQKRKNKKIDRIRSFPFFKSSLTATTSNEPIQHMREVKRNADKFLLKRLNGSLFEYFCSLCAHFQGYDL